MRIFIVLLGLFLACVLAAPEAGAQTLRVCSKAGSELDLNDARTSGMRAKLSNPNYFGPGGAVAPEAMSFSSLATVNASTLSACDIFIGGGFPENLSDAETTAISTWVNGGNRFVIAGCDSNTHRLCGPLGMNRTLTNISSGFGVSLTQNLSYNPITCGGVVGVDTYGGAATVISALGSDSVLAVHNGTYSGQPAAIAPDLIAPKFLMTADPDMFGSAGNTVIGTGAIATSDQAVFVLNAFKFAADALGGRLQDPQCPESYNERIDLELAMVASASVISVGQTLTLTITVANTGADNAGEVRATVRLPAGLIITGATGDGSVDTGTGIWTIGALASGGSVETVVTVEATSATSGFLQAEITNANLPDVDSAPNASFSEDDLLDGLADDDEAQAPITVPNADVDWSDAPLTGTSYGAASHEFSAGVFLGAGLTSEGAAYDSPLADGDADDGLILPVMRRGEAGVLDVTVAGAGGYLSLWADWNGDGVFETAPGSAEVLARDAQLASGAGGVINVPFVVPQGASGTVFIRARWSLQAGLAPGGQATSGEVEDYRGVLEAEGDTVSGRVFLDTGAGGATAHDGVQAGDEAGRAGVRVELLDGTTLLSASVTDGAGDYSLSVPDGAVGPLRVRVVLPDGSVRHISGDPGGLSDSDTRDGEVSFTPVSGASPSGVNFGLVPIPVLEGGQSRSVAPGASVLFPHRLRAGTAQDVSFGLTVEGGIGLAAVMLPDAGCDGVMDAGAVALSGPVSVAAGESRCILIRATASSGVAPFERFVLSLTAGATYADTSLVELLENIDTVDVSGAGVLELSKTVCNASQVACDLLSGAGFGSSNAGRPGETLVYRLSFTHPGSADLNDVRVLDRTPDYSALSAGGTSVVASPVGAACALSVPGAPLAGYRGVLEWVCPGVMRPGEGGVVSFSVVVDD